MCDLALPLTFGFICRHCPILFNLSSKYSTRKYNDFGSSSFKKINFIKKIPFKCIMDQF